MSTMKREEKVIILKSRYGAYDGKVGYIQEKTREFTEVDENGEFDWEHGLTLLERDLPHGKLPKRIYDNYVEIDYPEENYSGFVQKARTITYVYSGDSYSIYIPDDGHCIIVGEDQFKRL